MLVWRPLKRALVQRSEDFLGNSQFRAPAHGGNLERGSAQDAARPALIVSVSPATG